MTLKIDQAMDSTVLNGGLAIDLIFENGVYSVWGGSSYTSNVGVYTPDANRERMELKTFPASSAALTLSHTDEHVGFLQAIIKYPADKGSITIKQKAEAFLDLFTIGNSVVYESQKVYISSKNRDGGRIEGGYYQIVCTVNYRAFVAR